MNEPRRWTFLCIWYENSWFRVYEVKRLFFSVLHGLLYAPPSTAANLPYLPGSSLMCVLTSFVPPVHNQGVSLAPNQGPALWKIFLPTTGSFFVLFLTDFICMIPKPAPYGGRFPCSFLILFSLSVTAEFNFPHPLSKTKFNCDRILLFIYLPLLCCL